MIASLKLLGTVAIESDRFTISVITGSSISKHCFNSHVGVGSRLHDFEDELMIIHLTVSSETGGKSERVDLQCDASGGEYVG